MAPVDLIIPQVRLPDIKAPSYLQLEYRGYPGSGAKIYDHSRYRKHGTLKGSGEPAFVKLASGLPVLDFDGIDDYVTFGGTNGIHVTGALTLEAWVYADTFKTWSPVMALFRNGTAKSVLLRRASNGKWQFVWDIGSTPYYLYSDAAAVTLSWVHLVGVIDEDGDMSMYVDGVVQADTDSAPSAGDKYVKYLGWNGWEGPAEWWDGKIGLPRISTRGPKGNEVMARYNAYKGLFGL